MPTMVFSDHWLLPTANPSARLDRILNVTTEKTAIRELNRLSELRRPLAACRTHGTGGPIGRFDRFRNGKQLSRFCGLSPRNASSGNRQADAGLIKAGNPQLRVVLVELAHRLKRWEPRWAKLALTMRMRGKKGSVIAAAVANRWVRWLFHQMQTVRQAT